MPGPDPQALTLTQTQPIGIYPNGQQAALTLYNPDATATIIVSSAANTGTGFPIGPGDTIVWDEGKPLYAWLATAGQASLIIIGNSGGITSAKAIATQIVESGLSDDIVAGLVAGLPTPTANALFGTGVPSADNPANLYSTTDPDVNIGAFVNFGSGLFTTPADISKYNSVYIRASGNGATGGRIWVTVIFYAGDPSIYGNNPIATYVLWGLNGSLSGNGSSGILASLPAVGRYMSIKMDGASGATTVTTQVVGSYRVLEKVRTMIGDVWGTWANLGPATPYTSYGTGQDGNIVGVSATGIAIPSSNMWYPPTIAGPCRLFVRTNTPFTAGSGTCYIIDQLSGIVTAAARLSVGDLYSEVEGALGYRPIRIQFDVSSGATPAVINVQWSLQYLGI